MDRVVRPQKPMLRRNLFEEHEVWPDPRVIATGRALKRARLMAGLSQSQLAVKSGISQSVISRFERGLAPGMSVERLTVLSEAVGWRFPIGFCPHDHDCKWPRIEPIPYDHPPPRQQTYSLPRLPKHKRRRQGEVAQRMVRAGALGPGLRLTEEEYMALRARITEEVDDERARSA